MKYIKELSICVAYAIAIMIVIAIAMKPAHGDPVLGAVSPDRVFYSCLNGLVLVTVGSQTFYYQTRDSTPLTVGCDNFKHP